MSIDDKIKDFHRPDFGTFGQVKPAFARGLPDSKRPGAGNNIDLLETMKNMATEHYSDARGDDGVTGRRLCLVVHTEVIPKDDIRDPSVESVLEMQAAAMGEVLTEVLVVYGPVAGGTSAMLSTPIDPSKLPEADPARAVEEDYTRIIRYPRFYAIPFMPAPIIGQPAWVEFIDKELQSWGWFHGMVKDASGQVGAAGQGNLSPLGAFAPGQGPVPSFVADMEKLDLSLTPDLPPESAAGMTYNKLMKELSSELGLELPVAYAFFRVEAGGIGMCKRDKPGKGESPIATRFEPHVFAKILMRNGGSAFENFKMDPKGWWVPAGKGHSRRLKAAWKAKGFKHGKPCTDYDLQMLQFASKWDERAAFEASSFGLPQIMGFHYRSMGFSSAKQMYLAFSNSEEIQIRSFFQFIRNNSRGRILQALKRKDFPAAVRIYNGSKVGSDINNKYSSRLRKFSASYASSPPGDRPLLNDPMTMMMYKLDPKKRRVS